MSDSVAVLAAGSPGNPVNHAAAKRFLSPSRAVVHITPRFSPATKIMPEKQS
jgi:hypothetical protein